MDMYTQFTEKHPVDLTTFLGQWPHRLALSKQVSDLVAMADQFQLTGLCTSHIGSIFGHDTLSGNEMLLSECTEDERLWPFVILNPNEPSWSRELAWAVEHGARGIRFVPGYHGYVLNDLIQSGILAEVRQYDLPLQIMIRLQDERLAHPRYQPETPPLHTVAEFIVEADRHPILFSGLRTGDWQSILQHLPEGQSLDHVYADLWHCNGPLAAIQYICEQGWSKQFAYGSCTPIQTAEATMFQLAMAHISEQDRDDLCRGNALRFLNKAEDRN